MPKVNKATLIISSGLAGVGKTTHLKSLAKVIENSIYLDKDSIAETLLGNEPYFGEYYNNYVRNQSYQVMLKFATDNLALGKVVILDGYFGDKLNTDLLKNYLHSPKFETKIIHFNCSKEILKARVIERGDARDQPKLQDFDSYYTEHTANHSKQLASVDYLEIETENKENLTANVKQILEYVRPTQYISPRAKHSFYQSNLTVSSISPNSQTNVCKIM